MFMKKRISRVLNFFAFNLLFFALYLNFIHKDSNAQEITPRQNTPASSGTTLVSNPEQYLQKDAAKSGTSSAVNYKNDKSGALRLSFN
jgi:hypothetical protein